MKRLLLGLLFASCISNTCDSAIAAVADVDSLNRLRAGDAGTSTSANVKGYASANDGGGGQFVQGGTPCTDDDGVVIEDGSGNCWYRQFSGPVYLAWYGVQDAASSGCYTAGYSGCDATGIVQKALFASANYGGDGRMAVAVSPIASVSKRFLAVLEGYLSSNTEEYRFSY